MKVLMTVGITAIVDLDERSDMTMKIDMLSPKMSMSVLHIPSASEQPPDPQQARDLSTIALAHVLSFLAKSALEKRDEIGSEPTQLMPNGGQPS